MLSYVKYSSCYLNDQKKQMLVQTCKVHELQEFESDLPNEEQGITKIFLFKKSKVSKVEISRTF